jgi:hypothetical protein
MERSALPIAFGGEADLRSAFSNVGWGGAAAAIHLRQDSFDGGESLLFFRRVAMLRFDLIPQRLGLRL